MSAGQLRQPVSYWQLCQFVREGNYLVVCQPQMRAIHYGLESPDSRVCLTCEGQASRPPHRTGLLDLRFPTPQKTGLPMDFRSSQAILYGHCDAASKIAIPKYL